MRARRAYDYIIVGAGAAGSVLAARLGEDPGVSVLILEAGPSDASLLVRMPAALSLLLTDRRRTWQFETGPEPALDGRSWVQARGRMLGGSGSINGMVFVRGNPRDYEAWAAAGLADWSYRHCLPYFKKLERFAGGANAYRGGEGPIGVRVSEPDLPVFGAFLEAGRQAGQVPNPDYNSDRQEGIHVYQANIERGVRASGGRQYLRPALRRGNVELRLETVVRRITFSGRRATGVTCRAGGEIVEFEARREVIVCGGAFNSPQLLLLSGVGPAGELSALGIDCVADLPGVGRNLVDHPVVSLKYRAARPGLSPMANPGLLRMGLIGARWLFLRTGLGARNFWEVGSFFRSAEDVDYVDLQHEFPPVVGEINNGRLRVSEGFQYQSCLMRPRSRGSVTLRSADPEAPPRIVMNYLADPDDVRDLIRGLRRTEEIVRQPAWEGLRGEAITPELQGLGDEEVAAWLRQAVGTQYHPASSCRMGVDDMAVVDAEGRVHGTEGLRVVDASIMPAIVSGNLHAPTMMIAEKIADRIRGRAPLPPLDLPHADLAGG